MFCISSTLLTLNSAYVMENITYIHLHVLHNARMDRLKRCGFRLKEFRTGRTSK